ncbi:MAG: glycosyltransferase, partial [Muribaculaceae bacterium]|nr:glycosyltransferase [Muribaculaceae bacterium]
DIIATGRIAKNMLPLYYQLMDVFVLPSYREGFGMSVLEASAMNKPVLVSRSHGCVDSIVEGETGLYIDISPEDIAAQIECVKGSTNSYGVNGRKWVCENFDSESMWPKVSSLLDELCLK